jgi:AraC-like DNA-binding protein
MASSPDCRRKESHRSSRRRVSSRKKLNALAAKTAIFSAKTRRRALPSPFARGEALPVDAIRANKYRQLALKHWQNLPRVLLAKLANLRCHVVWAPSVPASAQAFELRIPVVVDDGIIGFAFLLRIEKVRRKSSRAQFAAAAMLLRLFVRYVEAAASLELRTIELAKAHQQGAEHEHEEIQLRAELNRKLPGIFVTAGREEEESHTEQLVHRMLDYIQKEYTRPITLKECARNLEFNAAYLCSLFSRTIGLPFKSYLTRLRLEKARELLSDPTRRVSDVAYAVGYTDANRFRLAFKAATGLAPVTWRSSLRT